MCKYGLVIDIFSHQITIDEIPLGFSDDKSTVVSVMARCSLMPIHHPRQCWPSSMTQFDVTRSQWIKTAIVCIVVYTSTNLQSFDPKILQNLSDILCLPLWSHVCKSLVLKCCHNIRKWFNILLQCIYIYRCFVLPFKNFASNQLPVHEWYCNASHDYYPVCISWK